MKVYSVEESYLGGEWVILSLWYDLKDAEALCKGLNSLHKGSSEFIVDEYELN